MVMLSDNPIRKAFSLANEYIGDYEDDIAEDYSVEERTRACELMYKVRVRVLREDRMSDSEDEDIRDDWRRV